MGKVESLQDLIFNDLHFEFGLEKLFEILLSLFVLDGLFDFDDIVEHQIFESFGSHPEVDDVHFKEGVETDEGLIHSGSHVKSEVGVNINLLVAPLEVVAVLLGVDD